MLTFYFYQIYTNKNNLTKLRKEKRMNLNINRFSVPQVNLNNSRKVGFGCLEDKQKLLESQQQVKELQQKLMESQQKIMELKLENISLKRQLGEEPGRIEEDPKKKEEFLRNFGGVCD